MRLGTRDRYAAIAGPTPVLPLYAPRDTNVLLTAVLPLLPPGYTTAGRVPRHAADTARHAWRAALWARPPGLTALRD